MNTVFNIGRLIDLQKREVAIYWKQYLFIICGIAVYYIIAIFMESMYGNSMRKFLPVIYIILVVCVVPSIDKNLDESHASLYFLLPVSTFERFLGLLVKCVIIIPIMILGVFVVLDFLASFFVPSSYMITEFASWSGIYSILAFQSVFLLGHTYFKKRAFVKTSIVITIFFIVIILISKLIINYVYPEIHNIRTSMDPIFIYKYGEGGFHQVVVDRNSTGVVTPMVFDVAKSILTTIFPLGIWVLVYLRLRETEA